MHQIIIVLLLFFVTIGYGQTELSEEQEMRFSKIANRDKTSFDSIYQIDLDNDGEDEILTFQGNDLSYFTRIYNHEVIEIHRNYTAYSVVLDIDKDGVPELLEPIFPKEFLKKLDCGNCEKYINMSIGDYYETIVFSFRGKPIYDKIVEKENPVYLEISKGYNSINRFNKFFSLSVLAPIRILQYENGKFIDKTVQYTEHLRWRIDFLKRLKEIALEGEEKNTIEEVIKYVQNLLDKK